VRVRELAALTKLSKTTDVDVVVKTVSRRVQADVKTMTQVAGNPVKTGVPYLGDVRRAMDAIYNEDPAVLRARQRSTLAGYGLNAGEIRRFENTLLLSPTRQSLLAEYAKSLNGVAGRDELFRHAMSVTSDDEMAVFLQSAGLLASLHAHRPVGRILSGLRLPAAQFADGGIVVVGAFDAVYWTEDVATDEAARHAVLPASLNHLELWVAGTLSPRARSELTMRGWDVHDNASQTLAALAHET
jgi:hypothetical protein